MNDLRFNIVFDASTLSRSQKGVVSGQIWLVVDGEAFPEPGWSDFPIIVLRWWCENLIRILTSKDDVTLSFMDGPYEARIGTHDASSGCWSLQLIEKGIVTKKAVIESLAVVEPVKKAANLLLRVCAERGWSDEDIDALAGAFNSLGRCSRKTH